MENADQEKVKIKLKDLFEKPIKFLEEKFPRDFNRIEVLKNNLYDSIYGNDVIAEIYRKQIITKTQFKKLNSTGNIVKENPKNNNVTNSRKNITKTPTKYRKIVDEILLTPTSNVKSGDASLNNTKKILISNISQLIKGNKPNINKNNYSPLPIFNKKNKNYVMQLSYNENSKINNRNAKDDNSKSTNNTSIPRYDRYANRLPIKMDKNKSILNESVDVVPSKYTRSNLFKQNVANNIKQNKLNTYSKKIIKSGSVIANTLFKSNKTKVLALLCINDALPLGKRINLIFKSKELASKMNILKPLLIESRINEYERRVIILDEKLKSNNNDDFIQNYINKGFIPSKTAQNSLNFLSRDEEKNLDKLSKNEQIQNLFRLIYILLNEEYDNISPDNLITNLTTQIFQKYKVENLKSLFLNHLTRVSIYSDENLEKFASILNQNPKLLSSHEILKISKPLSFLCFIIKEIYEYANLKTIDGRSVVVLRKLKIKLDHYKMKIQELKKFLI